MSRSTKGSTQIHCGIRPLHGSACARKVLTLARRAATLQQARVLQRFVRRLPHTLTALHSASVCDQPARCLQRNGHMPQQNGQMNRELPSLKPNERSSGTPQSRYGFVRRWHLTWRHVAGWLWLQVPSPSTWSRHRPLIHTAAMLSAEASRAHTRNRAVQTIASTILPLSKP